MAMAGRKRIEGDIDPRANSGADRGAHQGVLPDLNIGDVATRIAEGLGGPTSSSQSSVVTVELPQDPDYPELTDPKVAGVSVTTDKEGNPVTSDTKAAKKIQQNNNLDLEQFERDKRQAKKDRKRAAEQYGVGADEAKEA